MVSKLSDNQIGSKENIIEYKNIGEITYKISKDSLEVPAVKTYISILIDWVHSVIHDKELIVANIEDVANLFVLRAIYSECTHSQIDCNFQLIAKDEYIKELDNILILIEKKVSYKSNINKWNSKLIYNKYIPAILHLLTALFMEFGDLPEHVIGKIEIPITSTSVNGTTYNTIDVIFDMGSIFERLSRDEALDKILQTPDKKQQFVDGILRFVDLHLAPMNRKIQDVSVDFKTGVNLIFLAASIGNFYIPPHAFCLKPLARSESVNLKLFLGTEYSSSFRNFTRSRTKYELYRPQ